MRAFSFCLYNSHNPYYYTGLLENIQLIHTHFPDWLIYIYLGNDVPQSFRQKLLQPNCRLRETDVVGHGNMIHRFFAIDEPDVDLMMVRDADSRIHWKDRWAITQFLESDKLLHIIRDSKVHTAPILGGLWGLRKPHFSMRGLYEKSTPGYHRGFGSDQDFLANNVYIEFPQSSILIHSTFPWKSNPEEVLVPFPFEWNPKFFCGRGEEVPTAERFSLISSLRLHNGR